MTGNIGGASMHKSSGVSNLQEEKQEEQIEVKEESVKEEAPKSGAKGSKLPLILVVLAIVLIGAYLLGRVISRKVGEFLAGRVLSGVTGGNVKVGNEGGSLTFENEEGKISFEEGGSLPDNFPGDFPVYPGAKIASTFTTTTEGKEGNSVVWETGDSFETVSVFYKTNLDAKGWKTTASFNQDQSATTTFEKEGWAGFMGVTAAEGKTTISVTIGVK